MQKMLKTTDENRTQAHTYALHCNCLTICAQNFWLGKSISMYFPPFSSRDSLKEIKRGACWGEGTGCKLTKMKRLREASLQICTR